MADAQNERTNSSGRRRGRRPQRGPVESDQSREPRETAFAATERVPLTAQTEFTRPGEITEPTDGYDVYCTHHLALVPEHEPMQIRTNMATLRHLAVDHFGGATLYCDCLHNGPHEWPPTLQRLETAVELDQFINASSNDT